MVFLAWVLRMLTHTSRSQQLSYNKTGCQAAGQTQQAEPDGVRPESVYSSQGSDAVAPTVLEVLDVQWSTLVVFQS